MASPRKRYGIPVCDARVLDRIFARYGAHNSSPDTLPTQIHKTEHQNPQPLALIDKLTFQNDCLRQENTNLKEALKILESFQRKSSPVVEVLIRALQKLSEQAATAEKRSASYYETEVEEQRIIEGRLI